jgi:nucleoid-associated protein YgaU
MLFNQSKLEKMIIRAFKRQPNGPQEVPQLSDDVYVVQVNPSSYTLNHVLQYTYRQGQGFSSSEAVHSNSKATVQFDFLFDGTGVVSPPSERGDIPLVGAIVSAFSGSNAFDVMKEIQRFNRLVAQFDSESQSPRRLLLIWGTFVFPCVLTSVNYRFTLFKPDGTPLRAVASCSFRESVPATKRERVENRRSSVVTHVRTVKEGDSLPQLTHDTYGNAERYLEVARANKLVNFRRLQAGSRMIFPPVDKESKP